jgi:hypothetical protein
MIASFETSINEVKENIKISKENIKTAQWFLKKIKLDDNIKTKLERRSEISSELNILTYKKTKLVSDNAYLSGHDECIYCGHLITDDHRNDHVIRNDSEIVSIDETVKSLTHELSCIDLVITEHDKQFALQTKTNTKLESETYRLSLFESAIKEKTELLKQTKANKLSMDEKNLYKNLENKKSEYDTVKIDVERINTDLATNVAMSDILADNGVKTYFLRKLLPLLNSYINKYLERFEMPFAFQFNELLEEKIITIAGKNVDVSYASCSEGEKKRIDISIMLSFIDIIKTISNWDCNLLFIDELLDSAVDSDNLKLIIDAIKQMAIENKSECIYVISHRADQRGWDKVYTIEKKGSFSKIHVGD